MYTEAQKAQMKLNGTPDASRDNAAAMEMKALLDAAMAEREADRNRQLATLEALATVLEMTGGVK